MAEEASRKKTVTKKKVATKNSPAPTGRSGKSAQERVEFKYVFADDYNPVYANGAFGGATPRGEVAVNFFVERPAIPYSQTFRLDASGVLGPEVERSPGHEHTVMVRYISTGVVMSLASAKLIRDWLARQIAILETRETSDEASAEKR
jgi:hypothetical protein